MTRTQILVAAAAVWSIMIAAGATFRGTHMATPQPSPGSEIEEPWTPAAKKGDRLSVATPAPLAVATAPSDIAAPVAAPPEQLPLATEDDIRQAEAEHHRSRDICPRGRTYVTIDHHQHWRCKR